MSANGLLGRAGVPLAAVGACVAVVLTFNLGVGGARADAPAERSAVQVAAAPRDVPGGSEETLFEGCNRALEPLTAAELQDLFDGGLLDGEVPADDAACRACHTAVADSMGEEGLLSALHEDVACTVCHVQDATFDGVHEDATEDTEKRLKKLRTLKATTVDSAVCQTCHGDVEELAGLTVEATALTDKNGLTVNPHLVATDLNTEGQHSAVVCANCHTVHAAKRTVEEQAQRLCLQCHHSGTYECYTCHA